jgi:hypothetical protein
MFLISSIFHALNNAHPTYFVSPVRSELHLTLLISLRTECRDHYLFRPSCLAMTLSLDLRAAA